MPLPFAMSYDSVADVLVTRTTRISGHILTMPNLVRLETGKALWSSSHELDTTRV